MDASFIDLTSVWGSLLPVWLPILIAPIIYLMRRFLLLAAVLSSVAVGLAGWAVVAHPPDGTHTLVGRTILLGGMGQVLLVILAAWLIYAFLYSWRISPGWSVFPFLLVVYGLIAASMFFPDLALQVLLLKVAWLVVIILVQGGTEANTRASTRLLILAVLALPPFLIAATAIEQLALQPDVVAPAAFIALALGIGFALMLAVIPFHAWLPQVAEDGPPLIAAWLVAGLGSAYIVLLFDLLAQYEWLAQDGQVQRLLFGAGVLLGISGGLLAVTERHLGRLWAYAILADLGYILLGLSLNSSAGRVAALLTFGSRLVSLLLAGSALATIRHRATSLHFDDLVGVGACLPLSMLAFAFGGLAMLGVPLTAGFPGHWAVLRLLAEQQTPWLWALLAASIIGSVGFLRAFAVMVGPVEEERRDRIEPEPRIATTFLVALGMLSLSLALAPDITRPLLTYILGSQVF